MPKTSTLLAITVCMFALTPGASCAGEWLGGEYWGQIGGCGDCGGSLYGGLWMRGCCPNCDAEVLPDNVLPIPAVDDGPLPTLARPVTFSRPNTSPISSRRGSQQRDIEAATSYGSVKTLTHSSLPERLYEEPIRLVAPNAWSDPIRR